MPSVQREKVGCKAIVHGATVGREQAGNVLDEHESRRVVLEVACATPQGAELPSGGSLCDMLIVGGERLT